MTREEQQLISASISVSQENTALIERLISMSEKLSDEVDRLRKDHNATIIILVSLIIYAIADRLFMR